MADIATLGINLELKNGAKATQGINDVAAAAGKAEAATKKLGAATASFGEQAKATAQAQQKLYASTVDFARAGASAAQIAQLTGTSMEKARQAVKQYADTMAESERETRALKAAQDEMAVAGINVATAAGRAAPGINSVRSAVSSLTTHALGAVPGMTQLSGVLGSMTLGSATTTGVLAAIAAMALSWRAYGEAARLAKDEQQKLTTALVDWYRTERQGPAGALPDQIEAATAHVIKLRGELEKINNGGFLDKLSSIGATFSKLTGEGSSKLSAFIRIFTAGNAFSIGQQVAVEAANGAAAKASAAKEDQAAIDTGKIEEYNRIAKQRLDLAKLELEEYQRLTEIYKASRQELVALGQARQEQVAQEKHELDIIGQTGYALSYLNIMEEARSATAKAFNTLMGEALRTEVASITSHRNAELQILRVKTAYEDAAQAAQYFNSLPDKLKEIGDKNKQITDAQTNETANRIKQEQKYSSDMEKIWRNSVGKIVTDGFKSYHDFFDDVLQLFNHLMDRMADRARELGKTIEEFAGAKFDRLQYGSAALIGGVTGYQSGSAVGGYVSGAVAGSAYGPAGAIFGAFSGAIGGMLGAANAHKEAAAKLKEAADSLHTGITNFTLQGGNPIAAALESLHQQMVALHDQQLKLFQQTYGADSPSYKVGNGSANAAYFAEQVRLQGAYSAQVQKIGNDFISDLGHQLNALDGSAGEYANQLDAINKRYLDNIQSARALGKEEQLASEIEEIRRRAIEQLNAAQANAAFQAFSDKNQSENAKRVKDMSDAIIAVAEQQRQQLAILQDTLDVNKQQLDAQQSAVDETRRAFDTLRKYSDSISLSGLSPLSPSNRYQEAKRQYDMLSGLAAGGDKSAIASLPDAANSFLEASRAMFASSTRYVDDYKQVKTFIDALSDQYGAQLTTQEKILAELQSSNEKLSTQIALLIAQVQSTQALQRTFVVGTPQDPNFLALNAFIPDPTGGRPGSNGTNGPGSLNYLFPYANQTSGLGNLPTVSITNPSEVSAPIVDELRNLRASVSRIETAIALAADRLQS